MVDRTGDGENYEYSDEKSDDEDEGYEDPVTMAVKQALQGEEVVMEVDGDDGVETRSQSKTNIVKERTRLVKQWSALRSNAEANWSKEWA